MDRLTALQWLADNPEKSKFERLAVALEADMRVDLNLDTEGRGRFIEMLKRVVFVPEVGPMRIRIEDLMDICRELEKGNNAPTQSTEDRR